MQRPWNSTVSGPILNFIFNGSHTKTKLYHNHGNQCVTKLQTIINQAHYVQSVISTHTISCYKHMEQLYVILTLAVLRRYDSK
jgi:hypothetical protein